PAAAAGRRRPGRRHPGDARAGAGTARAGAAATGRGMTPVAAPPPITVPPVPADHALLQRVLEQERIAHALPSPDWTEYLVEVARAALDALPDAIAPARDALARLGVSMETVR